MSTEMQDYAPLRRGLLRAEELRAAQELRPMTALLHTVGLWVQVIAAWLVVSVHTTWWTVLLAIPIIGTRYYALFIIGHDGLHRRLCRSQRLNDLWNDLLILGAIGAITRLNRRNHIEHHQRLATKGDPDRFKYERVGRNGTVQFMFSLTGLTFVSRALWNVFAKGAKVESNQAKPAYSFRDIAIIAAWQCALFTGLTMSIGWWAYIVLWWIPVYAFTFAADVTRVFAEHATLGDEELADSRKRLISFRSCWLERMFFAPMGMNHHAAHHLWPGIPYYNLRRVEKLVQDRPLARLIEWRSSYLGFIAEAFRAYTAREVQSPA
jgi:fatty acid desaturase